MNKDTDNFEEYLYDQDIGQEIHIEIPEIKYEPVTNIEEVINEETKKISLEDIKIDEKVSSKIEYKKVTNIEEIINENNKDEVEILEIEPKKEPKEKIGEKANQELDTLKEIENENILINNKEKNEIVESKDKKVKNTKDKKKIEKKETKPVKRKATKNKEKPTKKATQKVDNSYSENSTYLIVLIIVISIASIFLVLNAKNNNSKSNVIELVGEKTIVLNVNDTYKEPGFVAIDFNKGDVTKNVKIDSNINMNVPGIYKVIYTFNDEEVVRNVIVKNKNNIDFELKGNTTVFFKLNTDFVEEGYTALYNDKDYSKDVKVFGDVDLKKPGLYKLYYVISVDGNVAVLIRNVIIYTGEIIGNDESLVKEINNHLIDEIHYSKEININNVNESVLLYFGALNCSELALDDINNCLNSLFKVNTIKLKETTKYVGKNAEIVFDKNEEKFVIKSLDLPRKLDNLYKVIVEGDNIYVYEKYAYEVLINNKEVCDGQTKKLLYSSVDRNKETGYEICYKPCETCEVTKTRNYTETLYMHTFKKALDKYIWSKTEMIK